MTALALSPADPGTVYLAKTLGGTLSVLILEGATVGFAGLFLGAHVERLGLSGAAALILGAAGLSALGVMQAGMAVHARAREALLPLLLFPLAVPLILLGGRVVHYRLAEIPESAMQALWFLAYFDVLFMAAGFLLFRFIMED